MPTFRAGCAAAASAAAVMLALPAAPVAASDEAFSIAVIPDSQVQSLSDAWTLSLGDQAGWIAGNVDAEHIALATHVGDVVQGELAGLEAFIPQFDWVAQLERTSAALEPLGLADGGDLPYSISSGNHDYLPTGDKINADDPVSPTGFTTYYGPDRYAGRSWYGGGDPTGFNHYQFFEANGHTYLHLNLEYEPENPDIDADLSRGGFVDAIDWAQTIIDANPGVPTIVSTHKYLTDDDGGNPDGFNAVGYQGDGFDNTFGGFRTATGEAVWDELVRSNPQIFMTLNGHDHEGPYREDGEHAQVSYNDAGLPVFEILADYQDYVNPLTGSDPYLRLIELDPGAGTISNTTYSPTFDLFRSDPSTIEARLEAVLDDFEAGVPVSSYLGEDIVQVVLSEDIPGNATIAALLNAGFGAGFAVLGDRADAEAAILEFFGITDRADLGTIDFSPYLTDADSAFTFNVTFDAGGRPIPEPGTLAVLAAAGLAACRRRRRARPDA